MHAFMNKIEKLFMLMLDNSLHIMCHIVLHIYTGICITTCMYEHTHTDLLILVMYMYLMFIYVCFSPNDKEKNKDKRTVKRPLEEKLQSPEFAGMSKNKVKKLLRNPLKKLARSSEENYEKCVACANIRVCIKS